MENNDFMQYKICTPRDPRFIQMLVDEYNTTNISLLDLSRKYHTDASYQFRIHNIPIRKSGLQHSLSRNGCIKLNWNFELIKNEEEAYIAGLLFADGYISSMQIGLRLKKSDKKLVETVKNYFSSEITLQESKLGFSFTISSENACKNLKRLGKVKTGNPFHIPLMDKSLVRHFIRGYFDGDGTVFICKNKKNKFFKANICCVTTNILEDFKSLLNENGIECSINKEVRKGKVMKVPQGTCVGGFDMYRLFIRKKKAVEKFYHYLYDSSSIYLERKRKIFEDNKELFSYKRSMKTPS